ncbi:MAG TPA: LysM domain-containing protein, partial [Anaerolineales bacterium]
MRSRIAVLLSVIGLILTSCNPTRQQETYEATSTRLPIGVLTPFHSPTPEDLTATATIEVQIPITPAPTATPFLHTLTNDDTLLGLAFRYGVSLEDIQAVNPGVDPHYLTVGKQIVIPLSGEITQTLTTPTPIPITAERVICYPNGDGSSWCIAAIHNDTQSSLENISVGIGLYNSRGESLASAVAYAPLNILRPGNTMPLMAYFAPPLPDEFQPQSQVLSGLKVEDDDQRYLDLQTNISGTDISQDGKQVIIRGEVVLPDGTSSPGQLWALGVAYNAEGDIVGVRKWKSGGEKQFEITVYSLAGVINHVEVLTEARP